MGHIWVTYESHMGHIWVTYGSHMGHTWVTHGSHMGHIWVIHGPHMGHTWSTNVPCNVPCNNTMLHFSITKSPKKFTQHNTTPNKMLYLAILFYN